MTVYKESEKPPTYTMFIFTLRASEQQQQRRLTAAKLSPVSLKDTQNSHSGSVDLPPETRKQRPCLDAAHKSAVFTLIKPITKLPINHSTVCRNFMSSGEDKQMFFFLQSATHVEQESHLECYETVSLTCREDNASFSESISVCDCVIAVTRVIYCM